MSGWGQAGFDRLTMSDLCRVWFDKLTMSGWGRAGFDGLTMSG